MITGHKTAEQNAEEADDHDDTGDGSAGSGSSGGRSEAKVESDEGTLIRDATCAPQAIRFPTDTSLLSEARQNT